MIKMTEAQARAEYAKWFVREHFLPQDYQRWLAGGKRYQLEEWERIQQEGAIRYKKHDKEAYEAEKARLRMTPGTYVSWTVWEQFESWWRVELADIDLASNDDNRHVQWAREGRQAAEDDQYWQWLIKETEYYRVYHEALVRSYGVDVTAP